MTEQQIFKTKTARTKTTGLFLITANYNNNLSLLPFTWKLQYQSYLN